MEDFKVCSSCNMTKPLLSFGKNKARKDGFHCYCKECKNLKSRIAESSPERKKQKKEYSNQDHRRAIQNLKAKKYRTENPDKNRARKLAYHHRKYKSCPNYRLKMRVKGRMHEVLKGIASFRTIQLLGCSIDQYKIYLENKFEAGMSWENQGLHGWHIDHIVPLASFDLTDELQMKTAFHFSNTQPLWAKDNLSKNDKLDWKRE